MVFIFGATGGWPVEYPYILASRGSGKPRDQGGKQNYATPAVRARCGRVKDATWIPGRLIVDSAFGDRFTTNNMVISTALKIGANLVVPKDYPNEVPQTITSIREFYHFAEACLLGHIIPLQYPYEECFNAIRELATSHGDRYYGLGGLVGLPEEVQYAYITEGVEMLRQKEQEFGLGGMQVHLFGIYPTGRILLYIHEHPDWISSIDTTVPEIQACNGKILDITGKWMLAGETRGKHSMPMKYLLARYNLEMLSTIVNYPDAGEKTGGTGGIPVHIKHRPKPVLEKPLF